MTARAKRLAKPDHPRRPHQCGAWIVEWVWGNGRAAEPHPVGTRCLLYLGHKDDDLCHTDVGHWTWWGDDGEDDQTEALP